PWSCRQRCCPAGLPVPSAPVRRSLREHRACCWPYVSAAARESWRSVPWPPRGGRPSSSRQLAFHLLSARMTIRFGFRGSAADAAPTRASETRDAKPIRMTVGPLLLGRGGDPAHGPHRGGMDVPPPGSPPGGIRREGAVPPPLGGHVPGRGRLLELPGGRRLRLPDQPADGQLLPDRHAVDRQPRPRCFHRRLRDAGPGPVVLRPALPDSTSRLERPPGGVFLLDAQSRPGLDDLLQSVPARRPPSRGLPGERLLARQVARVLPVACLARVAAAAGRRPLYRRRCAGGLSDGQGGLPPAAGARAGACRR